MKKLQLTLKLITLLLVSFHAHGSYDKKLLNSRFSSWGISPHSQSSINLEKAWNNFKKKKDVVVAVVDTGIDPNHPFFRGNLVINKDGFSKSYGVDFSKSALSPMRPLDGHGHGTHVAGIIKSIFPNVKILTLKYYDPSASGEDNLRSTIKALQYAVDKNVDIINYSGGGPEASAAELAVLKQAEAKGILVVAASGNNGSNIDNFAKAYYPASYKLKNITTVTAHDQRLNVLNSSNFGKKTVDIAAPGYRIKSALPEGRAGYLTGTSQATAFVSGVAALLKSQFPKLDAEKIKKIINSSARQEISLAKKCSSQGRLDAARALRFANSIMSTRSLASTKGKIISSKKSKKVGRIIYRKLSSKNGDKK